uniref:Uncharacterized protein n=1 Tax=Timema genevievae TaxID=629358 RepID=A0A7R9PR07_TIMGE|nr:unnamed protein product [Timema genevievae]
MSAHIVTDSEKIVVVNETSNSVTFIIEGTKFASAIFKQRAEMSKKLFALPQREQLVPFDHSLCPTANCTRHRQCRYDSSQKSIDAHKYRQLWEHHLLMVWNG